MEPVAVVVLVLCLGVPVSCALAHDAGRGAKGVWGWGLFGPVGWIVAALIGVQQRLDGTIASQRSAADTDQ